ncbi:MAG: mucoidy inhibitor MuiA family protein [Sandaracinaceae bacterium]
MKATDVTLPVAVVTVMEDRARVTRRGEVRLGPGIHRLRVAGVAPVLVDKSLAARCDTAKVHHVSVTRTALHHPEERREAMRALELELEASDKAIAALRARVRRTDDALRLLEEASTRAIEELSVDAAWGGVDVAGRLDEELTSIQSREDAMRTARADLGVDLDAAQRDHARLAARRAELESPEDESTAALTIDVEVPGYAGEAAHVVLVEYVVPNACWRPQHRAVWTEEALRFEHEACVWQRTGEDWTDVQLRFSTQRASAGAEPPTLTTDRLAVRRKAERVQVEVRQEIVQTTGPGAGVTKRELSGIEDGGVVQELEAPQIATVPSDGRPTRVLLFAFATGPSSDRVCAPELTASVIQRTVQPNAASRPLLAGPVDLVKGGGFIGRTHIEYVAPGEKFELGWGPEPALRVRRRTERGEAESNLLGNWISEVRTIVLELSNLGARTSASSSSSACPSRRSRR